MGFLLVNRMNLTYYSGMKEEDIRNNFSKNIYSLRKSRNLSQAKLADDLNYTYKAISKWENKETIPDIATLSSIAEYFEITVDDLISNKDVVKKSNKKRTRRRITLSSIGICFAVVGLIYLALVLANVNRSYIVLPFAALTSGIVYLVFSSIWFKKYHIFLGVTIIVWSSALIVMLFMNYAYFWIVLIIAFIINSAFFPFLRIFYSKEKTTENK